MELGTVQDVVTNSCKRKHYILKFFKFTLPSGISDFTINVIIKIVP